MAVANGETSLGVTMTIPASGAWYGSTGSTAMSLSLPSAGTYLITVNARFDFKVAGTGGYLQGGVHEYVGMNNPFPVGPIANSVRMLWVDSAGSNVEVQRTESYSFIYTTSNSSPVLTFSVYRGDFGSPTWNSSQILWGSNGLTSMNYLKLS